MAFVSMDKKRGLQASLEMRRLVKMDSSPVGLETLSPSSISILIYDCVMNREIKYENNVDVLRAQLCWENEQCL